MQAGQGVAVPGGAGSACPGRAAQQEAREVPAGWNEPLGASSQAGQVRAIRQLLESAPRSLLSTQDGTNCRRPCQAQPSGGPEEDAAAWLWIAEGGNGAAPLGRQRQGGRGPSPHLCSLAAVSSSRGLLAPPQPPCHITPEGCWHSPSSGVTHGSC